MFGFMKRRRGAARGVDAIEIDDIGARRSFANGKVESVSWAELSEIKIVTTDDGPLADDVFWVLIQDESVGCVIPSGYCGIDKLLDRVQKLEGFDNAALIKAMSCSDNAEFVVWKKNRG